MGEQTSGASQESSQVDRLIAEYLSRVDAGDKLTQAQFISEHAEFAPQLRQYFADVSMVDKLPKGTTPGTATTEEPKDDQTVANTVVRGISDSETSVTRDGDFEIDIPDSSETSIEIPETFGRYRIVKVLGQGAMGAVYLARDTQLDRDVALKIPKFSDVKNVDREEMLARFYREARAAATLRSPNICPVYDVGEIDGQHYITMAYINGRPLRDFTKSDKTHSEKQIATTIRKLALALAEAHEIGVIHRDLKPANIMVDRKAEPVVMDFGLARRNSSDDVQVTQSGAIVGTPAYMAPEQVAGEQTGVGPQVDIYALGVIMYELITGQMPFKGNLMSILQQIALNNPKKPSELRREIDSRLENICLKMMAGDPKERFQTMEEVAADLQDYLRNPQKKIKTAVVTPIAANKTSLPTASQESNPALISIEQPKSYAEQLREKKSRSSANRSSLNLPEVASSGWNTPRNLLIAGGGVLSLFVMLGVVLLVRLGKYDVEITLEDPSIKLSIDGDALVIEDGQEVKRLSAGEHKLKLEAGSIIAEVDDFTVTKDGQTALLAKLVNQDLQVFRNGEKIYPFQANSGSTIPLKNPNVNLKNGLMGHWRFEEASGTRILDSSGKQNHGVVEGDVQWKLDSAPSPLAGKRSMYFDNGYVIIPVSRSLKISNKMSIAFWYKLDTDPQGPYFFYAPDAVGVSSAHQRCQFEFLLEGDEIRTYRSTDAKPADFLDGNWHHITVNCTGEAWEIWFDGRKWGSERFEGQIVDPVSDFILGREISGSMDDFRFYNRPLNESEIAALANVVDRTGFLGGTDATGENDLQLGFGDESMLSLNPSDVDSPEWGLYFDSQSDEVNFPSLRDKVGSVTIELWMQFDPDHHQPHSLIAGFGPLLRIGTNPIKAILFSTPGTEGAAAPKVSTQQFGIGQPVHVAGIRDFQQHQIRLYVNGKLIAIESVPPHKGEDFFQLASSKHQWMPTLNDSDYSFRGWIDEVRVSQGAKYSADFTPQRRLAKEPDTLALYHFDEGEGTVLKDTSGNGHHGEIVGATWVKGAVVPNAASTTLDQNQDVWLSRWDNIEIPIEKLSYDGSHPITIEGWVELDGELPNSPEDGSTYLFGSGKFMGVQLMELGTQQTEPYWHFYAVNYAGDDQNYTVAKPVATNHRGPTHIAMVYTKDSVAFFTNGKKIGEKQQFKFPVKQEAPGQIDLDVEWQSDSLPPDDLDFRVRFSDVRVSKVARYQKDFEPRRDYVMDDETLAIYRIDEIQDGMVLDSSGHNRHAFLSRASLKVGQLPQAVEFSQGFDLIPLLDLKKDRIDGEAFTVEEGELQLEDGSNEQIEMPLKVAGSYQLSFDCKKSNIGSLSLFLPVGQSHLLLAFHNQGEVTLHQDSARFDNHLLTRTSEQLPNQVVLVSGLDYSKVMILLTQNDMSDEVDLILQLDGQVVLEWSGVVDQSINGRVNVGRISVMSQAVKAMTIRNMQLSGDQIELIR